MWSRFVRCISMDVGRISGRSICITSLIKTVLYESGYFVLSMLALLVILIVFGLVHETFF